MPLTLTGAKEVFMIYVAFLRVRASLDIHDLVHLSLVVEEYTVVANVSFYTVTEIVTTTSGTLKIPFTLTFQLNKYNETFFRPTGLILLTVNITSVNASNTANFHFVDGTDTKMYTSVNSPTDSQEELRFVDRVKREDTLELQDVILFSFNLPSHLPVNEPMTYTFTVELFSGDCIGCEDPRGIVVNRSPIFEGSVTLIPPGKRLCLGPKFCSRCKICMQLGASTASRATLL